MPSACIILIIVLAAIMCRDFGLRRLPIWLIMCLGALLALLFGDISVSGALHAIDWNIIGYLVGVFIIGQAVESSGLLYKLSERCFSHAKSGGILLLSLIFIFGFSSALLMNDTIAIVATPLVIMIAKNNNISIKPLLLALAFSITIGSVMSPIGNPQNLLIANTSGLHQPFKVFLQHLILPTVICLTITALTMMIVFRKELVKKKISVRFAQTNHKPLMLQTKIAVILFILLIIIKIVLEIFKIHALTFSAIALIAAIPIILCSSKRIDVLKQMDWHTILFFIGMFVLIQSVWDSGMLQHYIQKQHVDLTSTPTIYLIATIFSQLISNVPLVALYLPLLIKHGGSAHQYLALAVASTLAGNFLTIGAASNIIIIQNAEKRKSDCFSFFEFMFYGIPLGIICLVIYALFL